MASAYHPARWSPRPTHRDCPQNLDLKSRVTAAAAANGRSRSSGGPRLDESCAGSSLRPTDAPDAEDRPRSLATGLAAIPRIPAADCARSRSPRAALGRAHRRPARLPAPADALTEQRDRVKQQIARPRPTSTSRPRRSAPPASRSTRPEPAGHRPGPAGGDPGRSSPPPRPGRPLAPSSSRPRPTWPRPRPRSWTGQERARRQEAMAGDMVRDQYQQQTNLLPIAMLVDRHRPPTWPTRIQWSTTMFDTTQAKIDRLTGAAAPAQGRAGRSGRARGARSPRTAPGRGLADRRPAPRGPGRASRPRAVAGCSRSAGRRAAAAAEEVAAGQGAVRQADRRARGGRAADRRPDRQGEGGGEGRRGRRRAAAKSAPPRPGPRPRRRKAQDVAAKRASASAPEGRRAGPRAASSTSSRGAHHGFIYPVSAPSPRRTGCASTRCCNTGSCTTAPTSAPAAARRSTPPYAGAVAERYYNAGYGNRLMIDHGKVDGKYVTTGYNHAIRYTSASASGSARAR